MGFSVPGQNTQNTAPRSAPVATSRAGNYATTMTRQQDAAPCACNAVRACQV